jgi:two-component system, OmpR family, phosphate regulon response regulator PhoB
MSQRVFVLGQGLPSLDHIPAALAEEGYSVEVLPEAEGFEHRLLAARPSIVVLSRVMRDPPPQEVIRRIRRDPNFADVPIIVVSPDDDELHRVVAFELGVDDFLAEPVSVRELVLRVRAILRRARQEAGEPSERIVLGSLVVDRSRHRVTVAGQDVDLTALEFRLLLDLARHPNRVQRRNELLERVWADPRGETRTLDTHVKRLRRKLGHAGSCIETVRGVGYRLRAMA